MNKKRTYETEAENLSKAIDIAISVIAKLPPEGFEQKHTDHMIKVYSDWKADLPDPEPQFRNLKSLQYVEQAVFTYFQEGTGKTVDEFWRLVKEENLGYKRSNVLAKILKRKKIKNRSELDVVQDTMVPLHQDGVLTDAEFNELSTLIGEFENKNKKDRS